MTLALRLIIYDFLEPLNITIYTDPASITLPNRFPDSAIVEIPRHVCRTIKDGLGPQYAVVTRKHYAALLHSQVLTDSIYLRRVLSSFFHAHTTFLNLDFDCLGGPPMRFVYPSCQNPWIFALRKDTATADVQDFRFQRNGIIVSDVQNSRKGGTLFDRCCTPG